jgi:CubicO group peptidase (beta-lactamase class C family)
MPADLAARRTQNLMWNGHAFYAHPYEHMMGGPAGGVSTTAADMARLLCAMLAGGTLDGHAVYSPAIARAWRPPLLAGRTG